MGTALGAADRTRISAAIAAAERGHRGEIVVHVELRCLDPLERAAKLFQTLGVDRTKEHTGVLLYLATANRRAAVWAGTGVTAGDKLETWKPVFLALAGGKDLTDSICAAVTAIGTILATHAVGADKHGNELADGVSS
jgi:uncharacterized membrane protein